MTVRLNLSDDEAHALLHLIRRAAKGADERGLDLYALRVEMLAKMVGTVRSKLECSEQRQAARAAR